MSVPLSWAHASVPSPKPASPLTGERRADVCVVGGGLTGLSAALTLAKRGASVILLEAGRIGDGASGLNGGQMIPGWRHGAASLIARFGLERAKRLHDLTLAARERTLKRAEHRSIDLKTRGHLTAAARLGDLPDLDEERRAMARIGHGAADLIDRRSIADHVGAEGYHGGLLDRLGGHLHPMKLMRAMAEEAAAAGAGLHEASAVRDIDTATANRVLTDAGAVTADHVVIACDAFIDSIRIDGRRAPPARRLMPVWSYQIATAPLCEALAAEVLPGDAAVSDTRFALHYFRLSVDRRLLFSGGERYVLRPLDDPASLALPRLRRLFPKLADVEAEYRWRGRVAVTTSRFPHVGSTGGVWFAHGYSGHGLLLAEAAGRAIGMAITGDRDDFDLLHGLPTRDWPGGRLLRHPLYTAGMLWFAMKDRL